MKQEIFETSDKKMFLQVEEMNQKWISEKENLLADTQLLISLTESRTVELKW